MLTQGEATVVVSRSGGRSFAGVGAQGHLLLCRYAVLNTIPCCCTVPVVQAEGVRDAALSAGRCFVEAYARSCMPLLLPAVERGLSGDNWRIRQSSLELCGDVLFKVRVVCVWGGGLGERGVGGASRVRSRASVSLLSLLAAAAVAVPPTPNQVTHAIHSTPRACCDPLPPLLCCVYVRLLAPVAR